MVIGMNAVCEWTENSIILSIDTIANYDSHVFPLTCTRSITVYPSESGTHFQKVL